MRTLALISPIICIMLISCKDRGADLIGGDGKKRLAENIWIARTSGTEYVLVDKHGEGIIYGRLLACKKSSNNQFSFSYKDFDSGKTVSMVLDENGSKVSQIVDNKGMIEVGEFYDSISISK